MRSVDQEVVLLFDCIHARHARPHTQTQDRQTDTHTHTKVALGIAHGDATPLRKALMIGSLGVNDAMHLLNGHTALHIAAYYGQAEVTYTLSHSHACC